MDQVTGQIFGEWLPSSAPRDSHAAKAPAPRHVGAFTSSSRSAAVWPISESVLVSLQRSASLSRNAAWGYAYGQPDRLIDVARRAAAERWSFLAPAHAVERALAEVITGDLSDAARRAVVATLAQRIPNTLDRSLPRSILELYPHALSVLADFLEGETPYDDDLFAKDIRFVSGATVPAGSQGVDILFSQSIGATLGRLRRTLGTLGRLTRTGRPGRALRLVAGGGVGDWLQIHTDVRDVSDFNPKGWERCYHRVADILEARPRLAGMLGISWFYDPQLPTISPRLRYLQDHPLEHGAFLVRLKGGAVHSQRAGATSPTRRSLIETGAYVPVAYALFWPRRELLRWARCVGSETEDVSPLRMSDVA